jgi:DNA ligase-1
VVEGVLALPVRALVADGEAIALRPGGRPQPFQVTAARFGRKVDVAAARAAQPLQAFVFDVLHLDGTDLIDRPTSERLEILDGIVPASSRVDRLVTDDPAAAQAFLDVTLAAGHEGVMAKSLTAPYEAGRRGAGWLKVKPVHTLDLVVLAVEWGSGRRAGTLSNIHLGARDPETGGFVMLGKTFKGMTDAMLAWQTERFLELETSRDRHVVHVRPEQVVEIAFDGIQTSSRYPGGMALRFARVVRYRDDKTAAEADTIDTVRALHSARS